MPPGVVPFMPNIWEGDDDLKKEVQVGCLLPTGIFILLKCNREATITNIKTEVWKQAKRFPMFNQLLDINYYVFQCINQNAEQEELLDEKRRLCDVQPFSADLRLILKAGDVEDKVLSRNISHLIDKGLHEFDMMKNEEIDDFRSKMQHQSGLLQKRRIQWDWEKKAMFLFPPQLESSMTLPDHLKKKIDDRQPISFKIQFADDVTSKMSVITVDPMEYPTDLIKKAIQKVPTSIDVKEDDFVLKIRGKLEYLLGNRHLFEYTYVRKTITKRGSDQSPELVIVHKTSLQVKELLMDPLLSTVLKKDDGPPPVPDRMTKPSRTQLSWNIADKVHVTIHRAWNVNVESTSNAFVRVRAGIFHGGEQLGECFTSTKEAHGNNPEWNEGFQAAISVRDLPRMARLCLLIGESTKRQAKKPVPLAWVNTTFFNYKNQLQSGKHTLRMWPAYEDSDLNPLGTVESNPSRLDTTTIEISFGVYAGAIIAYPSSDQIVEKAKAAQGYEESDPPVYKDHEGMLKELRKIVEKDPLEDLDENEKEQLWNARQDLRERIPQSLPRLLQCVQWDNSLYVAQMQALLQNWPELKPEEAMELLDYKYADMAVRKYAVMCLENLTDNDLSQYLLQLVQALKYETHFDCDLGQFLLRRALQNQRIGHSFFWHLRAEMHNQAISTRFGLLLEAYCRCNIAHMKILSKQVESLSKLKMVNELIKSKLQSTVRPEELLKLMSDILKQEVSAGSLVQFLSPLAPSYMLKEPKIEKCKFMGSKMKPLWLVFRNSDPTADDVFIMFKNGDDLRQDMLTLQVMQIMDNIWQEEGLDLRLIPYKVLATGCRSGLIEIVTGSATICSIQKSYGNVNRINAAFQKSSLFKWLKANNDNKDALDRAIEDFTYSCAGYCVATYVLGIGDRHNDNIMVKKTGQLFHIDFGHFLGNFKSKFGVKRERVPFVLTSDFIHVITRGNKSQRTKEYENFKSCCEEAFMILRRHGNHLINLFSMMLSSGIPELSASTIIYLRESLVLDKSDEEALKHFQKKFNEALKESWKTSLNWMFHNLKHD
ncbi:phosphatidylinositol 4,5-bisphosphate 3-kinase catalytic subunit beta isoform-like [Amphiura filiformis]|uniref:phosphatidylinositol 4,5-bisphosphate 3-kinase catalytic subunit beta isoform-like n=1 Tax=Amphiura filiformis TaxID=82378 RepID=UPI003B21DF92